MQIAFIEDTKLYGGIELWAMDAINFSSNKGGILPLSLPKMDGLQKNLLKTPPKSI